jgi:hypothetical protein
MVEKFVDGMVIICCPHCQNDFCVQVAKGNLHYDECEFCRYNPEQHEILKDVESALADKADLWNVIVVLPGDDEVICDLCNNDITEIEAGSFCGSYSLCATCTTRILKDALSEEKSGIEVFDKNFRAEVIKKRHESFADWRVGDG